MKPLAPVVEYELADLGHSLLQPLTALRAWAEDNHGRIGEAPPTG